VLCACASMRGYGCGSVVVVVPVWLRGCASKVVWLCGYASKVVWLCRYDCGCAGITVLCRYDCGCMCRYDSVVCAGIVV